MRRSSFAPIRMTARHAARVYTYSPKFPSANAVPPSPLASANKHSSQPRTSFDQNAITPSNKVQRSESHPSPQPHAGRGGPSHLFQRGAEMMPLPMMNRFALSPRLRDEECLIDGRERRRSVLMYGGENKRTRLNHGNGGGSGYVLCRSVESERKPIHRRRASFTVVPMPNPAGRIRARPTRSWYRDRQRCPEAEFTIAKDGVRFRWAGKIIWRSHQIQIVPRG